MDDRVEVVYIPPYILLPQSRAKSYWNIVNIFLLLYTALYMPYRISFIDTEELWQSIVDWMINILFTADIIVTFFSAYEDDNGDLVSNCRQIADSYIRSWFLLDCIVCFPFELLDTSGATSKNYQKLLRLMRLPRLIRFLKIIKVLKQIKILNKYRWYKRFMNKLKMNAGITRMITGIIVTIVVTHLMACFWYLSAKILDFNPDTWVYRKGLLDADHMTLYLWSLYWSVQTVITLGYGDVPAVATMEILLSLVWMLSGQLLFSFIVSTYTTIIQGNIEIDASIQMKLKSLTELTKLADIPLELSQKMKKYIEQNFETF